MLHAPSDISGNPIKERILTLGSFGVGKTYQWLKIALWHQQSGSPATFYVLDTDASVGRMLVQTGSFAGLTNVRYKETRRWEDIEAQTDEWLPIIKPHDWFVVDFLGVCWEAVQDWYTRRFYHMAKVDYFENAKKNLQAGNPLDGWKDWSYINARYNDWVHKVMLGHPGHVYVTAVADTLRDTDSAENKMTFGRFGIKPRAQKHAGHQVHTVLLMSSMGKEWFVTTIKDRERPSLEGMPLQDLAVQYLVGVAGWTFE